MTRQTPDECLSLFLDCGARAAARLTQADVVTSSVFRDICQGNGCGNYGKCHMCPPDIGPIDELIAQLRAYPEAILYQSVGVLEDSFDIEGMTAHAAGHSRLSQQIDRKARALLPDGFLHLSCGGCHLCPICARRDDMPCRHPEQALSSLEAYGVDVYQTAQKVGLPYINGANTVTYFGMILFGA